MSETIYVVISGELGPGDHTPLGYYKSFLSAEKAALAAAEKSRYGVWKRRPMSRVEETNTLASWSNDCDYVDVRSVLLED